MPLGLPPGVFAPAGCPPAVIGRAAAVFLPAVPGFHPAAGSSDLPFTQTPFCKMAVNGEGSHFLSSGYQIKMNFSSAECNNLLKSRRRGRFQRLPGLPGVPPAFRPPVPTGISPEELTPYSFSRPVTIGEDLIFADGTEKTNSVYSPWTLLTMMSPPWRPTIDLTR